MFNGFHRFSLIFRQRKIRKNEEENQKKASIPSCVLNMFDEQSEAQFPKKREGEPTKRPAFRFVFKIFLVRKSEAQYRIVHDLGPGPADCAKRFEYNIWNLKVDLFQVHANLGSYCSRRVSLRQYRRCSPGFSTRGDI